MKFRPANTFYSLIRAKFDDKLKEAALITKLLNRLYELCAYMVLMRSLRWNKWHFVIARIFVLTICFVCRAGFRFVPIDKAKLIGCYLY